MFIVEINFREGSNWRWNSTKHEFRVIPRQSEMIWMAESANWFRVDVVVHPVENNCVDAVLYVVDSGLNAEVFQDISTQLSV